MYYYLCLCVYVHACGPRLYLFRTHQTISGVSLQAPSIFFFWPDTLYLGQAGWPMSFQGSACVHFDVPGMAGTHYHAQPGLLCQFPWIQSQVVILGMQILCQAKPITPAPEHLLVSQKQQISPWEIVKHQLFVNHLYWMEIAHPTWPQQGLWMSIEMPCLISFPLSSALICNPDYSLDTELWVTNVRKWGGKGVSRSCGCDVGVAGSCGCERWGCRHEPPPPSPGLEILNIMLCLIINKQVFTDTC